MDDLDDTFNQRQRFGLRERGKRNKFKLIDDGGIPSRMPIGGNSNPGASIGDMYEMHYLNNNEIPPRHDNLDKLDFIRFLRKKNKGKKAKIKRKSVKKCKCEK